MMLSHHTVAYLPLRFFHNTLSICIHHRVSEAQARVSVHTCQGSFVAPQSYQHQLDLPAMFRVIPSGNLPHGHLQSVLMADRAVLTGIWCLGGCDRAMSTSSFTLLQGSHVHSFHGPRQPLPGSTPGYLLTDSNHLPNAEGGSDSHRHVLHKCTSQIAIGPCPVWASP